MTKAADTIYKSKDDARNKTYISTISKNVSATTDPIFKTVSKNKLSICKVFIVIFALLAVTLPIIVTLSIMLSENKSDVSPQTVIKCDSGYVKTGDYCDECGITDVTPNIKIAGGVAALPFSWPYQAFILQSAYIQYDDGYSNQTDFSQVFCGGVLIDRLTVLTAAHCIFNGTREYIVGITPYNGTLIFNDTLPTLQATVQVFLGLYDLNPILKYLDNNSLSIEQAAVLYNVSQVIIHPEYNHANQLNDIAILKLSKPVELNSRIKLGCLPKKMSTIYPSAGRKVSVAGWGYTSNNPYASITEILQNVQISVYDNSACDKILPTMQKDYDRQFCAGSDDGRDTCLGDSGGGLWALEALGGKLRYVASGLVSYGDGCAQPGKQGLYARISYYLDWIKTNMG